MGKGILVRDNTNDIIRLNSQTLQSAYQNGLIADCKNIDTNNPFAEVNRPRLVDNTCANRPSDLSWGIREVFFKNPGSAIIISITGVTTSGVANIWFAIVSLVNNSTRIGDWVSTENPDIFTGTNGLVDGTKGLVPAPTSSDTGKVLTSDGNWGYPRRTIPVVSCSKNATTGVITQVYEDGSKDELITEEENDSQVMVKEYNAQNVLVRTYVTTIEADGSYTVAITDA